MAVPEAARPRRANEKAVDVKNESLEYCKDRLLLLLVVVVLLLDFKGRSRGVGSLGLLWSHMERKNGK